MDIAIDLSHPNFGGRATYGYTAEGLVDETNNVYNVHGTHVAGIVGSESYGVAVGVNLIGVQVSDWRGYMTWGSIIDGMEWVKDQHINSANNKTVVNLSATGGINQAVMTTVKDLYDNGIVVVVSAGNYNYDACYLSPAASPYAITVGAIDFTDTSAYFSNWGQCVDVFAPGMTIMSTFPQAIFPAGILHGTSMAAPHVSGAVARYMSSLSYAPTPDEVKSWVNSTATTGSINWYYGFHATSPNKLLFADCAI